MYHFKILSISILQHVVSHQQHSKLTLSPLTLRFIPSCHSLSRVIPGWWIPWTNFVLLIVWSRQKLTFIICDLTHCIVVLNMLTIPSQLSIKFLFTFNFIHVIAFSLPKINLRFVPILFQFNSHLSGGHSSSSPLKTFYILQLLPITMLKTSHHKEVKKIQQKSSSKRNFHSASISKRNKKLPKFDKNDQNCIGFEQNTAPLSSTPLPNTNQSVNGINTQPKRHMSLTLTKLPPEYRHPSPNFPTKVRIVEVYVFCFILLFHFVISGVFIVIFSLYWSTPISTILLVSIYTIYVYCKSPKS